MKGFNPNLRIDQYRRYKTSIHGQRLAGGDEKVAVCTDCHAIHQMHPVSNPVSSVYPLNVSDTCGKCHADPEYMQPYAIPSDQLALYKKSVHFEYLTKQRDLSAPTCNDCHGNHGAVPPSVQNIHFICGTCHASNKELFDKSAHYTAFQEMDMPECVTCHSNHDVAYTGEYMLSTQQGVCWDCHDVDSDEGKTIVTITAEIESLKELHATADSLITLVERKGMEVSEYRVKLIDVSSSITKTRNLVHTISLPAVQEETQKGVKLAETIIDGGNGALHEIRLRRTGMMISLLFIVLVIIALFIKIRSLPESPPAE